MRQPKATTDEIVEDLLLHGLPTATRPLLDVQETDTPVALDFVAYGPCGKVEATFRSPSVAREFVIYMSQRLVDYARHKSHHSSTSNAAFRDLADFDDPDEGRRPSMETRERRTYRARS